MQALAFVVNEGYIKKWQGNGGIVQQPPKGLGLLSIEGRLSNSNTSLLNWETRILSPPRVESWPKLLMFTPINEEIESGAIKIERTRIIAENVDLYETLYIPNIN